MAKTTSRLETARRAYREALEAARTNPTPEAWARLLAAGKDLSAAEDPRRGSSRKPRRAAASEPTFETAPDAESTLE
jgi:hypothetical protein